MVGCAEGSCRWQILLASIVFFRVFVDVSVIGIAVAGIVAVAIGFFAGVFIVAALLLLFGMARVDFC